MSSPVRAPARPSGSATVTRAVRTGAVCGALALALLVMVVTAWPPLMTVDRAVADGLHRRAVARPGEVRVARVLTDWVWDPWTARALIAVAVVALWWRGARLPKRVAEVAPSARRAGPAASGACDRKAEGRPDTGCIGAIPTTRRACVPGAAGQAGLSQHALAGWIAGTMLFSTLLQQGIKAVVGRERPQWQDPVDSAQYAAFPSGHAMSATVGCGLLLWLLWRAGPGRAVRAAAVSVACLSVAGVSFTRVYLGVHWLSDVVAGVLLGVSVVAFSVAGHTAFLPRSGRGWSRTGNLSHRS